MKPTPQISEAVIVGSYRYSLRRKYAGCCHPETMLFIMLNPSTADDTNDDPTIRRCVGFALRRDYAVIEVVNLFALRATNPDELRKHPSPVGPLNDEHIDDAARRAAIVVCAWGNEGALFGRGITVRKRLHALGIPLFCFGTTKTGQPKHPLYLRADSKLQPWGIS